MGSTRIIKEAKVVEVVKVVYLGGEENSATNPLRLITEYRSANGEFLAEFDEIKYQKENQ